MATNSDEYEHATYCAGFELERKKHAFSKKNYMALLEKITTDLNNYYEENEVQHRGHKIKIKAIPEPICEGGIRFNFFNQPADKVWYKSMRHNFANEKYTRYKWPFIWPDTAEKWINDQGLLLSGDYTWKSCTILKAFNGAPAWTAQELAILKAAFELHGFQVSKMPRSLK